MTELTKTLKLKLVDPNVHKRRKLRETREAYQQALQDAFDAGCTTQIEANDVVVNYDLSGYAKNALIRSCVTIFDRYRIDSWLARRNTMYVTSRR